MGCVNSWAQAPVVLPVAWNGGGPPSLPCYTAETSVFSSKNVRTGPTRWAWISMRTGMTSWDSLKHVGVAGGPFAGPRSALTCCLRAEYPFSRESAFVRVFRNPAPPRATRAIGPNPGAADLTQPGVSEEESCVPVILRRAVPGGMDAQACGRDHTPGCLGSMASEMWDGHSETHSTDGREQSQPDRVTDHTGEEIHR